MKRSQLKSSKIHSTAANLWWLNMVGKNRRLSHWPLGCCASRFESRSGHECLSLCLYVVLSCVGRGLCDGLITRPEESYRVSNTVWSRKPWKGPYVPSLEPTGKWMKVRTQTQKAHWSDLKLTPSSVYDQLLGTKS
jgi:hypothetical protein